MSKRAQNAARIRAERAAEDLRLAKDSEGLAFKFSHEKTERYYTVDGFAVKARRRLRRFGCREMARRCGWSTAWQRTIEASRSFTLAEGSARILAKELGISLDA